MKKNLFALMAFLCSMALFTACSDDDDEDDNNNVNEPAVTVDDISGTYTGTLIATWNGAEMVNETKSITLSKTSDTTLDLIVRDFSVSVSGGLVNIDLGDVTVSNCTVVTTSSGYSFSGSVVLSDVDLGTFGGVVDCDVAITSATLVDGVLNVSMTVSTTVFGAGITVEVQFNGEK